MYSIIKENKVFFIGLIVFLSFGAGLLLNMDKGDMVRFLNHHHHPGGDVFFKYYTWVGDGLCYLLLVLLLFFYRKTYSLLALICFATVGLTVQLLKNFVFYESLRPRGFFENTEQFHLVSGVTIHLTKSFPSGHTATAFSMFCLLALFFHPRWGLLFLILAVLTGISRMYLFQHFLIDVYFGALLGTLMTLGIYYIYQKKQVAKPSIPN